MQVGLGARERDEAKAIREKAEALGMYFEGIGRLPRSRSDRARFAAELKAAELAGAEVVRTVLLSGRRYEAFDSAASFRKFADEAFASLALAAEVLEAEGSPVRLAVENHKDFRADELAAMLKRIGSDRVGVCLDTGNSIALLEDPMEVVEALAPWAFTTHFKDMGVQEYERRLPALGGAARRGVPRPAADRPRPPPGEAGDPVQPGDDHARPAGGPLPDPELLGDVRRPPRQAPGPLADDGPRPSAEAGAAPRGGALSRGAAQGRGRQCPALPRAGGRDPGVVSPAGIPRRVERVPNPGPGRSPEDES